MCSSDLTPIIGETTLAFVFVTKRTLLNLDHAIDADFIHGSFDGASHHSRP